MVKKYELLLDDSIEFLGQELFRIRALTNFGSVKAGDLGGYIQSEKNLSHDGNAWVADNAKVCGNAKVFGDAQVFDSARVFGSAKVCDNAQVFDSARVYGNAQLFGNVKVYGYAVISNNAGISGYVEVYEDAEVYGYVKAYGNVKISGNVKLSGEADVCGNAQISKEEDILVFKNHWSSFRYFTYTRSNKMWKVGCFYGTSKELVDKAYHDSIKSGTFYNAYVEFVESLEQIKEEHRF